jgi:hypothetical protein
MSIKFFMRQASFFREGFHADIRRLFGMIREQTGRLRKI